MIIAAIHLRRLSLTLLAADLRQESRALRGFPLQRLIQQSVDLLPA